MRTYIWTFPTRIFHWLLTIGFVIAFILGDFDNLRNLHFAFGVFVGTLIVFRLLFGIFGPAYSNFKDFPIGMKSQKEFFKTYFSKIKTYAGHNPASSVVMLLILLIGLTCSISGYLLYATDNNVLNIGISKGFIKESHEVTANLFLLLVCIHLLGIVGDVIFHNKSGTLKSIFTGYKNIEAQSVKLNGFNKVFIIIWFLIPFYIFYLAYGFQILPRVKENKIEHKEHH